MGFRTVVILSNDRVGEWEKDTDMGSKISHGMNYINHFGKGSNYSDLGYGRVVECTHADTQTLALIDSLHFTPVVHSFWRKGELDSDRDVRILKHAADALGYRLVKKAAKD